MKSWGIIVLLGLLMLITAVSPVFAKDSWHKFSAKEAQDSSLGKEKLKPEIKLYMKGEKHAKIIKTLGEFKTNRRTRGFGRSAQAACEWTFVTALMALQDRAIREGGNAVVDIYSITKNKEFVSAEKYSCAKGGLAANVALMGTVAKLAE